MNDTEIMEASMRQHLRTVLQSNHPQYSLLREYPQFIPNEFLSLRESTLPQAGLGVFAAQTLPANKVVTVYSGYLLSREEARQRVENNEHISYLRMMYFNSPFVVDGYQYNKRGYIMYDVDDVLQRCVTPEFCDGVGSMINHSFNNSNCKFFPGSSDRNFIAIKTKRQIEEGEELFLNYGTRAFNQIIDNVD